MDCALCGRPVVVEHLEEKPDVVFCEGCAAHNAKRCLPQCAACRIEAMSGYDLGQVKRLSADQMMALMWKFEPHAVVWQNADRQITVVAPTVIGGSYGLHADALGWCKRRQ